MDRGQVTSPFGEDELEELPLSPAPLVKVLAQIRFPRVLSIGSDNYIAGFQERIRSTYPVLREEMNIEALIGADGVQQQSTRAWRFHDIAEHWSVVLSSSFLALETDHYTSRNDFLARWAEVLQALASIADPTPIVVADRLGVRYINRLVGEDATTRLEKLIRPELYGPLTMPMPLGMKFVSSVGQAHFELDGPQMQARWGKLPPNATFLPDVSLVEEPSWMLDIDVFFEGSTSFEPEEAAKSSAHATNHAYRFFRWATSEQLIAERSVE